MHAQSWKISTKWSSDVSKVKTTFFIEEVQVSQNRCRYKRHPNSKINQTPQFNTLIRGLSFWSFVVGDKPQPQKPKNPKPLIKVLNCVFVWLFEFDDFNRRFEEIWFIRLFSNFSWNRYAICTLFFSLRFHLFRNIIWSFCWFKYSWAC